MKELHELKQKLADINKAKQELIHIKQSLEENKQALMKAKEQLNKEHLDVVQLEHWTLLSLLALFTHDKQERLEKEKQEEVEAILYVRQLEEENEVLRTELRTLSLLIDEEAMTQARLERLQIKRLAEIPNQQPQYQMMKEQMEHNRLLKGKLQSTIEAGNYLRRNIIAIKKVLDQLETGAALDQVFDHGNPLTVLNHTKIYELQKMIAKLQIEIYHYGKELEGITTCELYNMYMPFEYELQDLLRSPYFRRIHREVRQNLSVVRTSIEDYQNQLVKQNEIMVNAIGELEKVYEDLRNQMMQLL